MPLKGKNFNSMISSYKLHEERPPKNDVGSIGSLESKWQSKHQLINGLTMVNEAVSTEDISAALGINDNENLITPDGAQTLSYRFLTEHERDQVILNVCQTLARSDLQKTGEHRQNIWELAWKAQVEKSSMQNFSRESLVPDFMSATPIIRFQGRYIRPINPKFEFFLFDVFRSWLFRTYCQPAPILYEFGCGSGFNLVALSSINSDIQMVGLDWAEHSLTLIKEIASRQQLKVHSRKFNFYEPDEQFELNPEGIVLTVCALEQTGNQFKPFVNYLLEQKPKLCIHIEPIYEFYDPESLFDYLAMQYHQKRNYLCGFWPYLRALESQGRILIHKGRRLYFGSLFHEAYNYVIWEPL